MEKGDTMNEPHIHWSSNKLFMVVEHLLNLVFNLLESLACKLSVH